MTIVLRRDAAENRQKLVAAAVELFAVEGALASLEAVARNADVSIGTLYNRFPDRSDLLEAVLTDPLEMLLESVEQAAAMRDSGEAIATLLTFICESQSENRALADLLAGVCEAKSDLAVTRRLVLKVVESTIKRAHKDGTLRSDFTMRDVDPLLRANAHIAATSDHPAAWRRNLGYVLDGLRSGSAPTRRAP